MSRPTRTLAERHADQTHQLILDAAVRLIEEHSVAHLSVREIARTAGISERTVFRYFATRDLLLDAVAQEVIARLVMPPHPRTVDELMALPGALYRSFEAREALTRAALHSELFPRIRDRSGLARWQAIRTLVGGKQFRGSARVRDIAAANIRFFLSAMTWNYYRHYFSLSLEQTIACAETAIRQSLDAIR